VFVPGQGIESRLRPAAVGGLEFAGRLPGSAAPGAAALVSMSQFAATAATNVTAVSTQANVSLATADLPAAPVQSSPLVRNLVVVAGMGAAFLCRHHVCAQAASPTAGPGDMKLHRLVFREILHRKLSFALGVVSASVAVAFLVASLAILQKHDARTEQIIAAKEAETRQQMAKLEDDYRKLMLKMGFNVMILRKIRTSATFTPTISPRSTCRRNMQRASPGAVWPPLTTSCRPLQAESEVAGVRAHGVADGGAWRGVPPKARSRSLCWKWWAPGTMILGHELARSLPLKVGDRTRLMDREFTVAKINPERGNKDDITVWINLPEAQELLDKRGLINGILALDCTCDTVDRLGRIRSEIARILPDTQIIEYASQALTRAEARQRAAAEAQTTIQREKERSRQASQRTGSIGRPARPGS